MCLGIPGRVIKTFLEHDLHMARIDFGGVYKNVCLEHTPEAKPGDYVLVHVGFALAVVDPEEAHKVFTFLKQLNELGEIEQDDLGFLEGDGHEVSSRIP
jgi:hydrogenase expression/formation protein HypC